MKMRKLIALALSLCMLLSVSNFASAFTLYSSESLSAEKMDDVNIHLSKVEKTEEDLALEREMVDENGMIPVFIVMEGASVLESNNKAVAGPQTLAQMNKLEKQQNQVLAQIEKSVLDGAELDVSYHYTWLFNGVAATVPYSAIAEIAAMDGVKQVVVQPVYELHNDTTTGSGASLHTNSDGVMVGRENAWAAGYTGEGMKIAVIDTGLDVDHPNFAPLPEEKLTEDSATMESVGALLGELNAADLDRYSGLSIEDVYHNTKVVFGFNYADNNLDITHDNDANGDHGTHVAGIAAANKVDGVDVVGVAPDAQLFIMKVYGYAHGGYGSDIIAALEDALILGVDVVNMSLGTNAGFSSSTSEFINAVYARVAETNTVLSVSAGNSYTAGYGNMWGTDQNQTSIPDNAVISEPSIYQNILSIASVENVNIMRNYMLVSDGCKMGYVDTNDSYGIPNIMTLTGEYQLVHAGLGTPEEFAEVDVTGKIALVQRGTISFLEKCQNADDAGAIACIVYNNTDGEFGMDLTDCTAEIPGISITMADGEYLLAAIDTVTVSFPTDLAPLANADAYVMSDFSSWGVTPELRLEPDITAPGGNIYSTITDGQYGLMSGTSMAAPNVSGITALVMQYAKANYELEDYRTFVQNLLMSASTPLSYDAENGLYFSPRQQGSGLANAYDAISTLVYLTVAGSDTPKVSLGDDADKTGVYEFTYTVHNFGENKAYYALSTVAQTEGYATYEAYEGKYFMSGTPEALLAATAERSNGMVLTFDLDDTNTTDSRDAYLLNLAAKGQATEVSFRYDTNGDEAVDRSDVQAYLDALVGNESEADLTETVLCVQPGETADVTVTITLDDADKTYFDTYYPNGGYVEGFSFLTALHDGGVDLSLPYLGFYGSWDSGDMIDDGNYWDMLNDPNAVVGNQYVNVLWTNFYGQPSYYYPGANVYVEEEFDMDHISVSPNGDGYFDTVDDIYTSLLRNAGSLTYRYTNMETGEVYYEQTDINLSKSVYNTAYGQIVPTVYSWFEEAFLWDWTDNEGNDLTNNTKLLLEVIATGAYEGATPDTWAVPITVDLEAPELLSATKTENNLTGEVTLELTFRDNLAVSVAAVTSSNGNTIYGMEGVADVEPAEDGYQYHTVTFDITDATGKLMIILGDYAMNEVQYGLNLGGEGTPYDDLVAYQYYIDDETSGWASFGEGVSFDEVRINTDEMNFVCAEYVGGFVFAQTETGDLYGFRYEDMLVDSFDIESSYIASLDNTYQDLAYSYAEGKLYGMLVYEYQGYPTTEIDSINIHGEYYDEDMWMTVEAYQEDWALDRGGLYGLSMAIDDEGSLYVLGLNYNNNTETLGETARLWKAGMEYDKWTDSYRLSYSMTNLGDTGITMDFLQSMTFDHNSGKLYWARFDGNYLGTVSELYVVDTSGELTEDGLVATEKVGDLSGETCAMFAPLTEETIASNEIYQNVPVMDPEEVARPILRDDIITMNIGSLRGLAYDLDPWYTNYRDVSWSSSDPSVVEVNQYGIISAVSTGSATITVFNTADETKFDTVTVEVTALDLVIEGVVSAMGSGVGNVGGVCTYRYEMVDGVANMEAGNQITAPQELNYGLSLATSVMGRGYIWACEYGNTGMIYKIDPDTGVVVDVLQPVDGDMLFGITYSESQDTFAAIMNMYIFVDLKFTHEETQDMMGSYSEETKSYNYHRLNLLDCLLDANDGFVTNETGQGASSEIVFCGITTLEDSYTYENTYRDFLGNMVSDEVNYTSHQTLVLLDNVGRLWYIDEIVGMTKTTDQYGNATYNHENGSYIQHNGQLRNGMFEVAIEDEEGNVTYNVFNIRRIEETPLTDMYRDGTMPRITYHFSDIEFAGYSAEGAPMFAMSLYDYWNNGTTNELYLYVAGVGTGEWVMDYETWISYEVMTESKFYYIGDTGELNVIASIHSVEVTGGVDPEETAELTASYYIP